MHLLKISTEQNSPKSPDGDQDNGRRRSFSEQELRNIRDNEADPTTLAPGQSFQGTAFKVKSFREMLAYHGGPQDSFDDYNGSHQAIPNISLTAQDVVRWKMAWRAIQVHAEMLGREPSTSDFIPFREPFVRRCEDWPDIEDILDKPWVGLGFSAAALIYGGLHALAWFAHFDSSTEQLLWRISACVVMGGIPIAWLVMGGIVVVSLKLFNMIDRHSLVVNVIILAWVFIFPLITYPLFGLFVLMLPAYVLARGYLVVECFINLSHLPAGVYDAPNWATYFPHIS